MQATQGAGRLGAHLCSRLEAEVLFDASGRNLFGEEAGIAAAVAVAVRAERRDDLDDGPLPALSIPYGLRPCGRCGAQKMAKELSLLRSRHRPLPQELAVVCVCNSSGFL